jgi:hypothetical protein
VEHPMVVGSSDMASEVPTVAYFLQKTDFDIERIWRF